MKYFILIVFLLFSTMASATTYYVRVDGSDPTTCNGTADAPASAAPNCAWSHPFYALPPNNDGDNTPARIAGGDTLIIDNGQYPMGAEWTGSSAFNSCNHAYPYDCYMQPVPSGTSGNPTKILGQGYTSCPATPLTQLWGNERETMVINLTNSSNVQVQCLEITDHSNCIENHPTSSIACNRNGSYPLGPWAETGIYAANSTNLTFQNLYIHGMAKEGLHAGALTNFTMTNVKIIANGFGGWDGDLGDSPTANPPVHISSNSGAINLTNVEIGFSGCTENYPSTAIYGCWGQNEGGYGDGLGMAWTGGNWTIRNSSFHDNTQDGLDLLYANGTGNILVERSISYGNAGNQMKISGPALVQDNILIGNCAQWYPQQPTVTQSVMQNSDNCRALGNALVFAPTGATQTAQFNSIISQGDVVAEISQGAANSVVNIYNNLLSGLPDWSRQGQNFSTGVYWDTPASGTTLNEVGNYFYQTKELSQNNACPTNNQCTNADPRVTTNLTATLANWATQIFNGAWNPIPVTGSPLINSAINIGTPPLYDYMNATRPVGGADDVGAIEVQGSAPTASCAGLAISPSTFSYGNTASTGSFTLSAPSTCTWAAYPLPSTWILLSNTNGTGPAIINFKVNANNNAARNTTIRITGLGVSATTIVSQSAQTTNCSGLTVSPTTLAIAGSTLTMPITITAPAGCVWTLNSPSSWLTSSTVTESANAVKLYFTANSQTARTTTLNITGPGGYSLTVPVTQTN